MINLNTTKINHFSKKLLLKHFEGSTTNQGNEVAIFQPGKTKTGKQYFYALALEDVIILKGEKLSLFYHGGLNDELKQKLIRLKQEEPATRALRKKLNRAQFIKLFDVAKALPEETETPKEEPQPVKLVYSAFTGDDEGRDEPNGGDDQDG